MRTFRDYVKEANATFGLSDEQKMQRKQAWDALPDDQKQAYLQKMQARKQMQAGQPAPVARGVTPPPGTQGQATPIQGQPGQAPVARGVVPPPAAKALAPQQQKPAVAGQEQQQRQAQQQQNGQWSQQDMMRIAQKQFTPEEQKLVQRQNAEMKQYGVVLTPFKLYGGMKNPQVDNSSFQNGGRDWSQQQINQQKPQMNQTYRTKPGNIINKPGQNPWG
jgi:hypothetical protein